MATFLFFLINLFLLIILNLTCLTNYAESLCLLLWFFNLLYHGAMDLNFEVIFPFHPFTLWTEIWFQQKGKNEKTEKEKIVKLIVIFFCLVEKKTWQKKRDVDKYFLLTRLTKFFLSRNVNTHNQPNKVRFIFYHSNFYFQY